MRYVEHMSAATHYGFGGWVMYRSTEMPNPIYVRFELRDDREVAVELYVPPLANGAALSSEVMRSLPVSRIESSVNNPRQKDLLESRREHPSINLEAAAWYFDREWSADDEPKHWAHEMLLAEAGERRRPPRPKRTKKPFVSTSEEWAAGSALISTPETDAYPEEFYKLVAQKYSALSLSTRGPAKFIAEANNIPVSTVYRWIRKARKLGFLAPGEKGKTG